MPHETVKTLFQTNVFWKSWAYQNGECDAERLEVS